MEIPAVSTWSPIPPKIDREQRTITVMARCSYCGTESHETPERCPKCGCAMLNPLAEYELAYMWLDTLPALNMDSYTVIPTFDEIGRVINP